MYNATKDIFQLIAFLVRTGEAFFIMNGLYYWQCGAFLGRRGGAVGVFPKNERAILAH